MALWFWKKKKTSEAPPAKEVVVTPKERLSQLISSYRHGRDLLVVPEGWRDLPEVQKFSGKRVYVETPFPSIVRT